MGEFTEPEHGSLPLYQSADYCGHTEPPEPGIDDDSAEWDAYWDDHTHSAGNGDPICLLTLAGEFCPACTEAARDEEDLPLDEYVSCRLATAREPCPCEHTPPERSDR